MPFVVYAMRHSPSGRFYIGSTEDLPRRVIQWRRAFSRAPSWAGAGGWRPGLDMSRRVFETSANFAEYEFLTMEILADQATADDVALAENRAIVWAATVTPDRLLNSFAGTSRPGVQNYPSYRAKVPAAFRRSIAA